MGSTFSSPATARMSQRPFSYRATAARSNGSARDARFTTDWSTRSRSSVAVISRLMSSSTARSPARFSAAWSCAFRSAMAARAASPSSSSRSCSSNIPLPVSLLVTWMEPTVAPPATIAVAMTFWARVSERSRLGSKRGSSTARVTIVVFCCCATSPTKPVPSGTSAPTNWAPRPPTARRQRSMSPSAIQSEPPSAASAARTRLNTVGSTWSKSSDAPNSRLMDWSSRSRSTSSRSSSVVVAGALIVVAWSA